MQNRITTDATTTKAAMPQNRLLCAVLTFLNLKFNVIQYAWGRRLYGGSFYLIETIQLGLAPFWSDAEITSCQSKTLKVEVY